MSVDGFVVPGSLPPAHGPAHSAPCDALGGDVKRKKIVGNRLEGSRLARGARISSRSATAALARLRLPSA